jgi:hypothetical protein
MMVSQNVLICHPELDSGSTNVMISYEMLKQY